MNEITKRISRLLDEELVNIRDDLLQLCELSDVDMKKEIKLYFKNI